MKGNIINGETIGENEMQFVSCSVSGIRSVSNEMKRLSIVKEICRSLVWDEFYNY